MTGEAMDELRSRLGDAGARTALVGGATAPARPPDTVTVEPGVAASGGPAERRAPLYVTAEATSGRTVRRYDGPNVAPAADRADELVAERDPRAAWLCGRGQIRSWWGEEVADLLERRLAAAARRADARLVVWTGGDEARVGRDCESTDGDAAAVGDRYDVVLDL